MSCEAASPCPGFSPSVAQVFPKALSSSCLVNNVSAYQASHAFVLAEQEKNWLHITPQTGSRCSLLSDISRSRAQQRLQKVTETER